MQTGTEEYVNVEGNLVEKDALAIAERLADYDPNLYIICVDPNVADFTEAPFMVAELCPDGQMRKIMEVWELNNSVIERVMQADTSKYDVLTEMDKINAKIKLNNQQRYEEVMLENKEMATSIIQSPKTSYTFPNSHGGISKVFYNKPVERIS